MYREKLRLERADASTAEMIDASINFAITAWHMTDWISKEHPIVVDSLLGQLNTPSERIRNFQQWIRSQSAALAAFDVIANAAKHGGFANSRHDRPEVDTQLVAHRTKEMDEDVWRFFAFMRGELSLEVDVNGDRQPMIAAMSHALLYWEHFLEHHCSSN